MMTILMIVAALAGLFLLYVIALKHRLEDEDVALEWNILPITMGCLLLAVLYANGLQNAFDVVFVLLLVFDYIMRAAGAGRPSATIDGDTLTALQTLVFGSIVVLLALVFFHVLNWDGFVEAFLFVLPLSWLTVIVAPWVQVISEWMQGRA